MFKAVQNTKYPKRSVCIGFFFGSTHSTARLPFRMTTLECYCKNQMDLIANLICADWLFYSFVLVTLLLIQTKRKTRKEQ